MPGGTTRWSHTRGPSPDHLVGLVGHPFSLAARLNLFVRLIDSQKENTL